MSAIFTAFGIDWRMLALDTANFALLLFLLWYFLYSPLTKMLDERRKKVAQGVIDAELAEKHLEEAGAARAKILTEAGAEADEVVSRARAEATESGRHILSEKEAAAARLLEEAEKQAEELKAQALAESKEEVARLVVLGIEKSLIQERQYKV